jgi:hypothetical protein
MMSEELGRRVNVGLPHPLLSLLRAHCFASSVVTLQGCKRLDPFQGYAGAHAKCQGQGFMMATELTTYRVSNDPVSPVPVEGYVVSYVVFYERGLSVPS